MAVFDDEENAGQLTLISKKVCRKLIFAHIPAAGLNIRKSLTPPKDTSAAEDNEVSLKAAETAGGAHGISKPQADAAGGAQIRFPPVFMRRPGDVSPMWSFGALTLRFYSPR